MTIRSMPSNKNFRDNYDRIFRPEKKEEEKKEEINLCNKCANLAGGFWCIAWKRSVEHERMIECGHHVVRIDLASHGTAQLSEFWNPKE